MVHFCYLKNHLGIETVSCRLLQWMLKMDVNSNLKKLCQTFSSKYLQNKRVKLPQDCRVHRQHGRCIIVLEYQYGLLDVMRKRSIFQVIKEMVVIAPLPYEALH